MLTMSQLFSVMEKMFRMDALRHSQGTMSHIRMTKIPSLRLYVIKAMFFLPRYMTEKSIKKLDKICNEEFATLKKAYQYAINEEVRQDTMIREYAFSKDKNIAAYLKDDIKSIVLRYIQEDRESDAIVAVNIGMLLEDDLREIKSVAENASMRELILKINNTLS